MSCVVTAPAGANQNCRVPLSEAVAAIITDPSFNWANVGAVDNIENLRVLLQETRKGFVVELNGSEPTAAEVVTETTGFGNNIITSENTPSLIGYAQMNACDFSEVLNNYKGGTYNVAFLLANGQMMVTDKGTYLEGFQTQVYASRFGIPGRENQTQQFKINFNFLIGAEFDSYKIVDVNYNLNELLDYIPVGLSADIATAFDGSQIVLSVYTRCVPDDPKSGVMTAEIVKSTQGLVVTAVPTDNTDGTYTVLVQADGPVDLAPGEYAEFNLVVKDVDVYEEVSNTIKVVGQ